MPSGAFQVGGIRGFPTGTTRQRNEQMRRLDSDQLSRHDGTGTCVGAGQETAQIIQLAQVEAEMDTEVRQEELCVELDAGDG